MGIEENTLEFGKFWRKVGIKPTKYPRKKWFFGIYGDLGPAWEPVLFYGSVFYHSFRSVSGVNYTDLSSSVFFPDGIQRGNDDPSGA